MKVAILGYAGQGKSAYEYWNQDGNEITICDIDTSIEIPKGANSRLGEEHLKDLDKFDLIVRTPILHPRKIQEENRAATNILEKVTTVTNEFFRVWPTKNIIGVTGTKGKGTTSTLIAKMLEAAGYQVHLGGNIGTPPLDLLKNDIRPSDYVILELANFQLIDIKYSPYIAVCLMVTPEHLDWHKDAEEYFMAKKQIFAYQQEKDIAVFNAENENSTAIANVSIGVKIPYMKAPGAEVIEGYITVGGKQICHADELKLLGKHNWQNACAAVTAVWQIDQNIPSIRNVLKNFGGLPYRLELRREIKGVRYYDDSFATGPGATIAALEAIPQKKVLILGGFDRGLSLEELADAIKKHERDIQKVILVGMSAKRLTEMLKQKGFDNYVHESSRNMKAIVERASKYAHSGDVVLLSPAFASFDMFKNFEERGRKFNEAVDEL